MSTLFAGDVHAGLAGLQLDIESFDLGEGVFLRKTYAHLMAPFLMAFEPAPREGHHPAPWKAASGGFAFDVDADLSIPAAIEEQYGSRLSVAKTIVFLLRIGVNPAIRLPVLANHPFAALSQVANGQANLYPFEVEPRHFRLSVDDGIATADSLSWVKQRWQVTHRLTREKAEFSLAVDALDAGQFVQNSALALVSLWAALEALFSPSTFELRFRVSALIAAYLEPPGTDRAGLQKTIAKLYDKRSAAAHGRPKHNQEDLLSTFSLLRRVLMAMIDRGMVPSKDYLECLLFGCAEDS